MIGDDFIPDSPAPKKGIIKEFLRRLFDPASAAKVVVGIIFFILFYALPIYLAWNDVLVDATSIKRITFLQAVLLASVLAVFCGPHRDPRAKESEDDDDDDDDEEEEEEENPEDDGGAEVSTVRDGFPNRQETVGLRR